MEAQRYLLDTNICVFILRGKFELNKKIQKVGIDNCYLSEITVAELLYGAEKSRNADLMLIETHKFIQLFNVLPITSALSEFGKGKAILSKQGRVIENFDMMIGASAVANDMILVTDNLDHLQRVPGIKIENWIQR